MVTTIERAPEILRRLERLYEDVDLVTVREWKDAHPGRKAVGYLPVYAPREILDAVGILPVAIRGGGDRLDIVKGDAYFQSYICHLPRSVVEMGLSGRFDALDGLLFPSICDVIRNLSGLSQILFKGLYVRYLDFPQTSSAAIGRDFYRQELAHLAADMARIAGVEWSDEALRASIDRHNANRRAVAGLLEMSAASPWKAPASEVHQVLRAGDRLPVVEHTALIEEYRAIAEASEAAPLDQARVVVVGAFCEQPPLGLVRTLERAGCAIVADDLTLVYTWHERDVSTDGDPLTSLAAAYVDDSPDTAAVYNRDRKKGAQLIDTCRRLDADGVVLASPSFCDPSLLERPMLTKTLDEAGIPYTSIKYAENTAQFAELAEQAGTFSDTLKLWLDR